MKKFNLAAPLLTTVALSLPLQAWAIQINSLFTVADQNGDATFTIDNTQDKRLFLNVSMSEIQVVDGQIKKMPYTRDNIKDWKINVRPARTIINPGQVKDFKVTSQCETDCEVEKDQVFQLGFVPTPYYDETKEAAKIVQMAIGFGATLLYAGPDQPISYDASYDGENISIKNTGDSYLKARVRACEPNTPSDQLNECTKVFNVLAGRKLSISLPDSMRKSYVDLYLDTNKDEYSTNVRLTY